MKRHIQVTLSFEIDDSGRYISEEDFSEGLVEYFDDADSVRGGEPESYYSDLSDFFGFTVYGARSVEGVDYDDADDEGDIDEDESDDD